MADLNYSGERARKTGEKTAVFLGSGKGGRQANIRYHMIFQKDPVKSNSCYGRTGSSENIR
jgi:hypothetical protein